MTWMILSIVALIAMCAAFSGTETAIFSMDLIRLHTLVEKKIPAAALVERMRTNPQRVLGTLLLANSAVNVAVSAITTVLVIDVLHSAALGLVSVVITIVLVIFGEYAPKSYAARNSEKVALIAAYPLYALSVLLSPVVWVIETVVKVFMREQAPIRARVSEDEIRTMAQMGASSGTVEHGERELIERVFLFNDITAEDVMTPLEDITWLDGSMRVADTVQAINSTKYSRFPVRGTDGKAVGIVHIKDVLEAFAESARTGASMPTVGEIAHPPMFVAETKLIDDLFRDFQRQHAHMAVVINEFGSVAGIVTVDDLLAELVGEISDESDIDEHVIKRIDKTTIIVHGDAEISDINRFFNARLQGPSNKTVSRVILEKLGDVPAEGTVLDLTDTLTATVESVANLRIQKVRLAKK